MDSPILPIPFGEYTRPRVCGVDECVACTEARGVCARAQPPRENVPRRYATVSPVAARPAAGHAPPATVNITAGSLQNVLMRPDPSVRLG